MAKDEHMNNLKEQDFKSLKLKAEKWSCFILAAENQTLTGFSG